MAKDKVNRTEHERKLTSFHLWLKEATKTERAYLRELTGKSVAYTNVAVGGKMRMPLPTGLAFANAMRLIRAKGGEEAQKRLPDVQRGDVSDICDNCVFYRACREAGIKETVGVQSNQPAAGDAGAGDED